MLYQGEERHESTILMTPREFLLEMDEILELAAGTLVGPEQLKQLEHWDSTAMISFIALADISGARVTELQVAGCTTIADLMRLAKVQDRPS